jgi:hypothetical protein
MDLFKREAELRKQFENNQVQFLLTEVDTATTFCNVAKSSEDPATIERNVGNACEGYKTLLKFESGAHFDPSTKSEYDSKFAHLKSLLKELGQDV